MGRRSDPFRSALETLRRELREGRHRPMTRLTAGEAAARLSISATPVREALSRLAGEGLLVDRRGEGFFVPQLGARDIADLFRLHRDVLLIACADAGAEARLERPRAWSDDSEQGGETDAVRRSEQAFRDVARRSSPALSSCFERLQDQLAPVRAREPAVLAGVAAEIDELLGALQGDEASARRRALVVFHQRRIAAVPALVRAGEI